MARLFKVVERTHTKAMEQLQDGYVASVAASAGALAEFVQRDMHKYDVELIRQPNPRLEQASVRLQLKSTTLLRPADGDTHMRFRFKSRDDFDSLAMRRTMIKHLLVVMVVGEDQRAWTCASHASLSVRHCCYWLNLEGMTAPASPAAPVVEVPLANVFDAPALSRILDRVANGEPI